MKRFILLTRQRSGSTVIIRSLDEHQAIFCGGELFLNQEGIHHQEWQFPFLNIIPSWPLFNNTLNIPWGLIKTNSHVANFYSFGRDKGVKASGFKLMLGQSKLFPMTKYWLNKKGIKVIVLIRENPLDIHISSLKAKKDGYSHLEKGESISENKVNIDPSNILGRLNKIERDNNYLNRIANDGNLKIHYKELFNWEKFLQRIYDYLEVEYRHIEPVLKKRSKKGIKDKVGNYDQLVESIKNTKFEKFIS